MICDTDVVYMTGSNGYSGLTNNDPQTDSECTQFSERVITNNAHLIISVYLTQFSKNVHHPNKRKTTKNLINCEKKY